jgi:type I restriction enzyme S subunit
LQEQRRIVARIEELGEKILYARELYSDTGREIKAVTVAFLNLFFDSQLGTDKCPLRLLPEVANIARGKFGHRPRNEPTFYGGNVPFIQIGDISGAKRYIRKYSQTLNEQGLAISRIFPAGTVVIAITGATIGVTGILTFDSCFPDSIVGIQAKSDVTTPEFIYFAIEHAKKAALAEATQTTQPNINLKNLERLQVRVPSLDEQRRIVAHLDELQEKADSVEKLRTGSVIELDALMPSILNKAFRGEL